MNGQIKTVVLKQKLCKCGHTNKNILIWILHNTEDSTTGSKFIQNMQKERNLNTGKNLGMALDLDTIFQTYSQHNGPMRCSGGWFMTLIFEESWSVTFKSPTGLQGLVFMNRGTLTFEDDESKVVLISKYHIMKALWDLWK